MKFLKCFVFKVSLFFFNKNSRIFQNSLIKSIIGIIMHHKNVQNFLTSLDSEIGKKDYQNAKRIKKTNSKQWNL